MLSKAQNKYIRSLSQQKYRKEHNVFIAEGDKIAREWLASEEMVQMIVGVQEWIDANQSLIHKHPTASVHIVSEAELGTISLLQTPNQVLLVVGRTPQYPELELKGWCIALDDLQDPGNMGTIIRIADWFGIKDIVCSPNCVEAYNPKVVQAAMGGHLRVAIHTADLQAVLKDTKLPVFAATLGGKSVYEMKRMKAGILVIGNESKGISEAIQALATEKITIPKKGGAESLNAGVSAGILCSLLLPV
jgi:TrmH family RNA methyltransferase